MPDAALRAVTRWAYAYADYVSKDVLQEYGRKALGRLGRGERRRTSAHQQVERWNIHTVVPPPGEPDLTTLLESAYALIPPEAECMRGAIDVYVRSRITTGQPHDPSILTTVVHDYGCDTAAS